MKAKSIILGFLKALGVFGIIGLISAVVNWVIRNSDIALGVGIAFSFLIFVVLWAGFSAEED